MDQWYFDLSDYTFKSSFVSIERNEAKIIIKEYENILASASINNQINIPIVPDELLNLVERIDQSINMNFLNASKSGLFIKLTSRSPKDSRSLLHTASINYQKRVNDNNLASIKLDEIENSKYIALCEEVTVAGCVYNGTQALQLFLDSERIAEDLKFALEDENNWIGGICIREWDKRLKIQSEFRGFCWDRKLNCLGQYFHSLYFPELLDQKDTIEKDIRNFFEIIKEKISVPNCLIDFAWLGPGIVILIEVNPLMEGLGSFTASTGLFDWNNDIDIIQGKKPFELRLKNEYPLSKSLRNSCSHTWRKIIYGY